MTRDRWLSRIFCSWCKHVPKYDLTWFYVREGVVRRPITNDRHVVCELWTEIQQQRTWMRYHHATHCRSPGKSGRYGSTACRRRDTRDHSCFNLGQQLFTCIMCKNGCSRDSLKSDEEAARGQKNSFGFKAKQQEGTA